MIEDNKEHSMENENSNKSISNKLTIDNFDSNNTPLLKKYNNNSPYTYSTKLKSFEDMNFTTEFKKLKDLNPGWSLSEKKERELNTESVSKFVLDTKTKTAVFSKINDSEKNLKNQKIDFIKDSKISENIYENDNKQFKLINNNNNNENNDFIIDFDSVNKFVIDTKEKSAIFNKTKLTKFEDESKSKITFENERFHKIIFEKDSKIPENLISNINEDNDNDNENNKNISYSDSYSNSNSKLNFISNKNSNSNSNFFNEKLIKNIENKTGKIRSDKQINNNYNNNSTHIEEKNHDLNSNLNLSEDNKEEKKENLSNNQEKINKNYTKNNTNNNLNSKNNKSNEKSLIKKNTHNIQTNLINNNFIKKFEEEKLNDNNENENENDKDKDNNIPTFIGLKRLRKKAEIVKEKEKLKKNSQNFFEKEAELGSDNEDHDDNVKKIDSDEDDKENENSELDKDLEGLINDSEKENPSDLEDLKEKYFEDMLQKDKEDIKKVIKGPEQRRKKYEKKEYYDNTDLPLSERMKKYKMENGNGDGNMDVYFSDLLFNNKNKQTKESIIEGELLENEDDELKQMIEMHQNNQIKKFNENSKMYQKLLLDRKKENEKILENVIDLNKSINLINNNNTNNNNDNNNNNNNLINNKEKQNLFFIKGNFSISNKNEVNNLTISEKNVRFGSIFNPKNSFLHAMKNDKYYIKSEFEDNNNNLEDMDDIEKQKLKKEKLLSGFSSAIGNSGSYSGVSRNRNKNTNLSALFKNGNIYKSKNNNNNKNSNELKKSSSDLITANTNEDMNLTKRINN
jgi:hypothetical protein